MIDRQMDDSRQITSHMYNNISIMLVCQELWNLIQLHALNDQK